MDPRFAPVGRRAEDLQDQRRRALDQIGLALPAPDQDTAIVAGRTYQLPDPTEAVIRELSNASVPVPHVGPDGNPFGEVVSPQSASFTQPTEESVSMPTPTTDPNINLNGATLPEPEAKGFLARAQEYVTPRNGIIAAAVVIVGTAIYLAVTAAPEVAPE